MPPIPMTEPRSPEPVGKGTIGEAFLTRIARASKAGRKVILSAGPGGRDDRFALWRQYREGDWRAWELIDLGTEVGNALRRLLTVTPPADTKSP